jgi:SAM-dependent methyltransferase
MMTIGESGASVEIDDAGLATCRTPDDGETQVVVHVDGHPYATVPAGPGAVASCQLPPVAHPLHQTIGFARPGAAAFAAAHVRRIVLTNPHGLRASDVFGLGHPPLHSLPWITFDGVTMQIGGSHLPPGGDPGSLGVRFDPGVVATLQYPLEATKGFQQAFWYWPNAAYSNLLLRIDLLATESGADPFHFTFVERREGVERALSEVWLPNDLHSFVCFATDATRIARVQGGTDAFSAVLPGYSHFRYLQRAFEAHGVSDAAGSRVLDWGCGVGRLTAHFAREWRPGSISGTDIDAENVRWCASAYPAATFSVAPLWPPTSFDDVEFDGVFGVSVMTHLTPIAQAAWLAELARILRPGGIALLTFAGNAGTAMGSLWRDPAWWSRLAVQGIDAETRDPVLDGYIGEADYYRQTSQTAEHVAATWTGPFELLEIVPAAFGNQDLAVLRRR